MWNVLAVQTWSPHVEVAYSFDSPGWSIGVEFFLYACFPLLVPLVARLRSPRSILVGAAVVAAAMFVLAAIFVIDGRGWLPSTDAGSATAGSTARRSPGSATSLSASWPRGSWSSPDGIAWRGSRAHSSPPLPASRSSS